MSASCPELEIAKQAARVGGELVAEYYRTGCQVASKDPEAPYNLISEADVAAEKAIVAVINDRCPTHAILAEEAHHDPTDREHLWIIDPIDGTNNFVHNIPHFAVSIGYYHQGQAVCGVVHNPATGDWYEAVRGQGASCNGQPLQVSKATTLGQALVGVGFYYDRGAMMEATLAAVGDLFRKDIHGIRRFGTASLDLCQVACGRYGAYFEYQLSPWDFGAGQLIVSESGGRVTTCTGNPLPLEKTSLLASNGALHESVLEIVSGRGW